MLVLIAAATLSSCHREGQYDGRTVAEWYGALGSNSPAERSRAATIIAQSASDHPESADALLRALSTEADSNVHATLAGALGRLPPSPAAAVALERLTKDEHTTVRGAALAALGSVARRSPQDRARLASVIALSLRDIDHDIRRSAAQALAAAVAGDTALVMIAFPDLRKVALFDPLSSVRDETVGIIATLPIPDSAFFSVVGSQVETYSTATQLAALRWMAQHPHARNHYLLSLRKLTTADDYRVRAAALAVLGNLALR